MWTVAAGIALALPASWAAIELLRTRDDADTFFGVRLGMTSRQIREAWTPDGEWSTELLPDGVVALDWSAADAAAPIAHVRFEVHQGVLVALRADVRAATMDDEVDAAIATRVTPEVLRQRSDAAEGDLLRFVLIARSCPVHVEEVEERLGSL